ncbi:hypothetical protein Dimus_020317 [Dionaea muscipula]
MKARPYSNSIWVLDPSFTFISSISCYLISLRAGDNAFSGGLVIKKFIERPLSPKIKFLAGVLADDYRVYGCGVAAVHSGGGPTMMLGEVDVQAAGNGKGGFVGFCGVCRRHRWRRQRWCCSKVVTVPASVLCNDGGSYF